MSSPSDTESDPSESAHRAELFRHSGQGSQADPRVRRTVSTTPYPTRDGRSWEQQESSRHGVGRSLSGSTSRAAPPAHVEGSRHTSIPFAMSNASAEARRQNIMAMDRKRRLTGSTQESIARRRNVTGGFIDRENMPPPRERGAFDGTSISSRPSGSQQRHRGGSGANAEVIDLTNSPPPSQAAHSPPRLSRTGSTSTSSVYVVPRWQPDSEASECPICKRLFTFLFRRHHCRKCGRVVCNDCSPHRITIPRQFIVNPPGSSDYVPSVGREPIDLTGDDEEDDSNPSSGPYNGRRQPQYSGPNAMSGGEKVRLCNPCVPDPQPEPQLNYNSNTLPSILHSNRRDDLLSLSDALRGSRNDSHSIFAESFPRSFSQHPFPNSLQNARSRPLPLPPQSRSGTEFDPTRLQSLPHNLHDRYRIRGHMPFENPHPAHHRHHASESSRLPDTNYNRPRMRSMFDDSYLPRIMSEVSGPQRIRVNEEDICPICRRMLPPKGPGGDESTREAHIIDCISSRDSSNQTSSSRVAGSAPTLSRGPMHMLPFIATEKDCVGDDGNVPECSICMVEYDVGDELARLECLCKFHRECISEWFTRKQECPVHRVS